jgi:thiol-disulfide isomerase/thioredoxin
VVLNLWATWCPPCRRELPDLDRLQKAYASQGLVVVTLSNEERGPLQEYAARYPISTVNVYTEDLDWMDVDGRPLTFVIDRQGVVRACFIGTRSYDAFEREVEPWLRG